MMRHLLSIALLLVSFWAGAQRDGFIFHEVETGETKYGISKEYDITIEQLEKYNPEIKDGLQTGTNLLIPLKKKSSDREKLGKASDTARFIYHEVKPKQTLYSLSRDYGVSIADLRTVNPELKEGLKVGQTLKIPRPKRRAASAQSAIDTSQYLVHKVQKNQTAYSLGKRYHLSLDSLYLLNPRAEEGLQIGQRLRIPRDRRRFRSPGDAQPQAPAQDSTEKEDRLPREQLATDDDTIPNQEVIPSARQEDYFLYKVKTGDTFYALKRKFKADREELIQLNPELADGLYVDKYIIIPRNKKAPEISFLDRLFKRVEEPEPREPLQGPTKQLKDSLNLPPNSMQGVARVDVDTLSIDTNKTYRVALLLPFMAHLSVDTFSTHNPEFPQLTEMAFRFYQGFRLAADSLARRGMKMDLQVWDTRNRRDRIKQLIDRIKKGQYDLVVGPAFDRDVTFLAKQLEEDKIPVVSPLSSSVEVRNHPNLIKAVPGPQQRQARLAYILNNRYPATRIVFAHSGSSEDLRRVQRIKSRLNPRLDSSFVQKIVVSQEELAKTDILQKVVEKEGKEVIVIIGDNKVFVSDLVSKLVALEDSGVSLLTSQSLLKSSTLDYGYLNRLNLTMAEVGYPDYQQKGTRKFVQTYRDSFAQEPNRFSFQGYDMGLYFLRKLWRSGSLYFMESLPGEQVLGTATGFAFQSSKSGGGLINHYLHITGIRDLKWVRIPIQEAAPQLAEEAEKGDKDRNKAFKD